MHDVSVVNCVASGSRCAAKDGTFSVTLNPADGSCDMDREQARFFTTLITRYGKTLCYDRQPYTYDKALFIFSNTNSRYRVGTAKTKGRFSSHCCTCIIMRIPPTKVMQLYRVVLNF